MAVNYNPTDPVVGASRATKEVELWTDAGDTFADINSRLSSIEGDAATLGSGAAADGLVLTTDGAGGSAWEAPAGGGGGTIRIEDEGVSTVAAATAINFAGAGVTVTDAGSDEALVTISGGGGSSSFAGARVRRTTNQSISNTTDTLISFDTEVFDVGGFWVSGSPTRLTVPSDGYYVVNVGVDFASNGTGQRHINIYKNGTASGPRVGFQNRPGNGSDSSRMQATSGVVSLVASDYIEVVVFQDSGGSLNVVGNATLDLTFMSIHKVG